MNGVSQAASDGLAPPSVMHATYRPLERLRIILCQLVIARRKNIKLYIFVKGEYLRA